ncbi:MAG: hypothetical protein P1U86_07395 [Verrucomicrobiales bacterium]|nr:hypothetical protein [Verrucomicrobiales bacterium]
MPESSTDLIILHDELNDDFCNAGKLPLPWKARLVRERDSETPGLRFYTGSVSTLEKRYLESIEQRVRLANAAEKRDRKPALSFNFSIEKAGAELACNYIDGEPIMEFVPRQNKLESGSAIKLLLDLAGNLKVFVDYPRILSNIRLQDFAVYAEDGIRLRARLRIAYAVLREESPMSDFRLWEFWRDELTRFISNSLLFSSSASRRDRKNPLTALTRKMSALFKSFAQHSELNLPQKFGQLESLLRQELKDLEQKLPTQIPRILTEFEFPRTSVTSLIRKEYTKAAGDDASFKISTSQIQESFSGFVALGRSPAAKGAADTVIYFTTPEHWFSHSVIETINRKMTIPFLKTHHNGIRIRSMTCEAEYTSLVSDGEFGIPLPSLMMAKSGIAPEEALSILHRIHRAIAQFETADFPLELRSPWQIQLHFDTAESKPRWQSVLEENFEKWPAWDIRIRVETPPEHYLTRNSWHSILERLSSKFFPSLAAWMFDWKRFTWINDHSGSLDDEPFNWESKMNTLLQMAGTHLNEKDAPQRQKFLQLAEEVMTIP